MTLTLNRGVGRFWDRPRLGCQNLGIAGHRDGFFPRLAEPTPGDVLELVRPQHSDRDAVSQFGFFCSKSTSVLNPTTVAYMTLVTLPFFSVGLCPRDTS